MKVGWSLTMPLAAARSDTGAGLIGLAHEAVAAMDALLADATRAVGAR